MSEPTVDGAVQGGEAETLDREAATAASTQADAVDPAAEPGELFDPDLGPGWVPA